MLSVLRHFNAFRLGTDNVYAVCLKSIRKVERCLSAKLDNGGPTFFMLIDIEDIFECQRLEIQFVAGVIIGRNRFRIRIDHDRLEPFLFQGKGGVNAAVVELYSLTDSIWAAAEDHYLLAVAGGSFVFVSVGRIVIG